MKKCNNDEIRAGVCGISGFFVPLALLLLVFSVLGLGVFALYKKVPFFTGLFDFTGAGVSYIFIKIFSSPGILWSILFVLFNVLVIYWAKKNPDKIKEIEKKAARTVFGKGSKK